MIEKGKIFERHKKYAEKLLGEVFPIICISTRPTFLGLFKVTGGRQISKHLAMMDIEDGSGNYSTVATDDIFTKWEEMRNHIAVNLNFGEVLECGSSGLYVEKISTIENNKRLVEVGTVKSINLFEDKYGIELFPSGDIKEFHYRERGDNTLPKFFIHEEEFMKFCKEKFFRK